MPKYDFTSFFPFPKIRAEQRQAIEFILNAFESGKKCVIAQLGTGIGKSATGLTIARYIETHGEKVIDDEGGTLSGAYVLTTQKVLQQQYIDDFGPGTGPGKGLMCSIKSASNYRCCFYQDQSCAESRRIMAQLGKRIADTDFAKHCGRGGCCQYAKDKVAFINAPVALTNFSYFLAETQYGKQLKPRNLLIIDEAHNIEQELGKFVEVIFSEKFAKDILRCKVPSASCTQSSVIEWIKKTYLPAVQKHLCGLERLLKSKLDAEEKGFGDVSKQYEVMDKHVCKVNRFLETYVDDNWVMNVNKTVIGKHVVRKFEFKTIDVSRYCRESLFRFGDKILMMSATIVDKDIFCQSIGLNPDDVAFINIPSPFPVENRPIYYIPAGSMSMKNIEATLPNLAEAVNLLLQQHPTDKGMIHCVSFKIAQYLVDHVKSPRLITHNSDNRDQVLHDHITGKLPTVLLSPSMMEGIDLADDASRFQILCKVPFPYLGDAVIKKRMEINKAWYNYQTVKSIIQAMGRSIRNDKDHAISYILDSDWDLFFRRNKHMFPSDFVQSLT
jgi:Rad3-related DNA helicase